MSLYGKTLTLYGSNESSVLAGFANKIALRDIPYAVVENCDITKSWSSGKSLFDPSFNTSVAADFDALTDSQWQIVPMLYVMQSGYTGTVSLEELLNLFPFKYDITAYYTAYRYLYLWDGQTASFAAVDTYDFNTFMIYNSDGVSSGAIGNFILIPKNPNKPKQIGTSYCYQGSDNKYYHSNYCDVVGTQENNRVKYSFAQINNVYDFFDNFESGYVPPDASDDPYDQGGDSDTGGGQGNFDGSGDNVDHPGLPSLSAVDTGFIRLFNPSISQLNALASYMWSNAFDISTFKKIFADPMDCILGLSIVPVAVPNGGLKSVVVGNISTNIPMTVAGSQYVTVDCGSLNVNEYWGAYLDYSPYTKAEIYLPYIGFHAINVDDIMNKNVSVQYNVDILTGACTATVKCGESVKYSFNGQCSMSIPVTGNDWTNVLNGVLNASSAIGSMVATGGMSAPMAIQQIASTAVNDSKPAIERSGSLSGPGGMLGIQKPYIVLSRPRQAKPKNQNAYLGYPSFTTQKLENLKGYAELEEVHLENLHATLGETQEIESLLKSGVIY